MKNKYGIFRRKVKGRTRYYYVDRETGKQRSLGTDNETQARRLLRAKNEAHIVPLATRQIGRAYLLASDPQCASRHWQYVFEENVKLKQGENGLRWK